MNKITTRILELIAFIVMLMTSYIGVNPAAQIAFEFPAWLSFINSAIMRQVSGLSVSYLIHLILNPVNQTIAWYRPSRFIQAWLSQDFWIPFANLSYSFYLLHIIPLATFVFSNEFLHPDPKPAAQVPPVPIARDQVTCWPGEYAVLGRWFVIFFYALTCSALLSVLSYIFIEKPAIDAKRTFKNKYSKLK